MNQLAYYVSDPGILWACILLLLCVLVICFSFYSRRYFIARELIYGVCNPRPGYVEEVIASELAHARLQEGEIQTYQTRLSTLTKDEVTRKQQLHRSARCARERMERLKMYARYFNIAISDERIDELAAKKIRDSASTL